MQILPRTWTEWAPRVGVTDPHDPYSNVLVAAAYLAFLRDYFAVRGYTDERWMLVAYNWGPYNLQQFLDDGGQWSSVPPMRRRYALNILRAKEELPPAWEVVREESVVVVQPVQ
jgi:soluble lytic murein transglycosylase-like protein